MTNARDETTTFTYNPQGYLTTVAGPVSGATTTLTYDGYGRVRTVTNPDGYTVTTDYDAGGRPTKVTYPDGTYEEIVYDRLNAVQWRDRRGRWTRATVDAVRRVTTTRDPLGRLVTQAWGKGGSLEALIDANGNRTEWERDIQGRVTKEVRADGRETLDDLTRKYGELPSIVATRADYVDQPRESERLLLRAFDLAIGRSDTPNLRSKALSLADLYATNLPDVVAAARWLEIARAHLNEKDESDMREYHEIHDAIETLRNRRGEL